MPIALARCSSFFEVAKEIGFSLGFFALGLSFCCFLFSPFASASVPDSSVQVFQKLRQVTYENSPDVKLARSQFEQKSAALNTAWTRWAPRMDLRLSDTVSKDYSIITSGSIGNLPAAFSFSPTEVDLKGYQLVLQAPLYNRGVDLGLRKAKADERWARAELALAEARISWSLRQAYGEYLLQIYRQSTIDRSLQLAAANLQEAQVRFRVGSRTLIDVLKAQSQQAQLESRKVTYQADGAQAFSRLADATGLTFEKLLEAGLSGLGKDEKSLAATIETFANVPQAVHELEQFSDQRETLAEQLQNQGQNKDEAQGTLARIDLQARSESIQAKTIAAGEWPELLARGTLGKQTNLWGDTFSTDSTSYSYGLILNIPLFSFGSLRSLNQEASALIVASEIRRHLASEQLINNVQNLVLRGRALVKSVDALKFSLSKNNEIERLTMRTYQLGKATFLDLQIAQNDVVDAKIQLAQSEVDLAVLVWQIKWNLGSAVEPDLNNPSFHLEAN